jgi:hypothetical protein
MACEELHELAPHGPRTLFAIAQLCSVGARLRYSMSEMWDRWLRNSLHMAHSLWWDLDHVSYEAVESRRMKAHDYRAAGCMRLVREAPRDFESTFGDTTPSPPAMLVRRGLAPMGSVVRGHPLHR